MKMSVMNKIEKLNLRILEAGAKLTGLQRDLQGAIKLAIKELEAEKKAQDKAKTVKQPKAAKASKVAKSDKPKRKRRTKAEMEAARAAGMVKPPKAVKAKPAEGAEKPKRKRRTKAEMEAARAAEAAGNTTPPPAATSGTIMSVGGKLVETTGADEPDRVVGTAITEKWVEVPDERKRVCARCKDYDEAGGECTDKHMHIDDPEKPQKFCKYNRMKISG